MRSLYIIITLFISTLCIAQNRAKPDKLATDKGNLWIQPITHGSAVLQWQDQNIYIDPYGGAALYDRLQAPTLILITDIHGDHLNKSTLAAINTDKATLVVPQAVKDQLPEALKAKAMVINNGEDEDLNGINIAAIPMYNLPDDETSRHAKGRGNGYVLTLGGKKVYFSGDTEDIPEMRALKGIDVAFVCMNLPYTMDINQAADAVLDFKPKTVYPYHYRGSGGLSDVAAFKAMVNEGDQSIQVKLKDWYPQN